MAKKKLSRDQKRKLKKRKRKQRKKQRPYRRKSKKTTRQIKKAAPSDDQMIEILPPDIQTYNFDEQENRIKQVFGAAEVPSVRADTLQTYCSYLKQNLEVPCLLTGIESIGYFGWEERFEFGYGSKAEYERLRKERGSYHDQYTLEEFEAAIEDGWNIDIVVKVKRTTDGKRFTIPLSELEVVDKASDNYVRLNDYTVWMVNWR
jgi:hypothetical protein